MKIITFAITVAASFTVCLLAQKPPMPPMPGMPSVRATDGLTNNYAEARRLAELLDYPITWHGAFVRYSPEPYYNAVADIEREVKEARCPLCKRGGPHVHLLRYEWIEAVMTDGADKPRACVERFVFRCNLCTNQWRKNVIIK